eukprot:224444-Chlamydomonas_euryale.AAC.1
MAEGAATSAPLMNLLKASTDAQLEQSLREFVRIRTVRAARRLWVGGVRMRRGGSAVWGCFGLGPGRVPVNESARPAVV